MVDKLPQPSTGYIAGFPVAINSKMGFFWAQGSYDLDFLGTR